MHATIASDGLLVYHTSRPFSSRQDRIIIPRHFVDAILTALHIQLEHPSAHQLASVFNRYFFALDSDAMIKHVSNACHQCASLKKFVSRPIPQTTSDNLPSVGSMFAADVIKQRKQLILVIRECVTSFTRACLIENEREETLRNGLVCLTLDMTPLDGPPALIRTDSAPAFASMAKNNRLAKHRLTLELGHSKNINKNPIAEKAVQEVQEELLRLAPDNQPVSHVTLSVALANLNSRLRKRGLSSREMWTQRDQFTNQQIPMEDRHMIEKQYASRLQNHKPSQKSKCRNPIPISPMIRVGDLVYLYADRKKTKARDRYLVVSVNGDWCNIKKFIGNQLRANSYKVRKSDCFLVSPTLPSPSQVIPDTTINDENSEDFYPPLLPSSFVDLLPQLPTANVPPPGPPELFLQDGPAPQSRYPRREHRKPSYLSDYILE
uniref:uncharacterized protein LOC120345813 n=1 Tax=Styela clava TaxID=7725 RepID=UPI00193A7F57|nr:uncharacterized protein LOC120345813 [Styela clava]